MSEIDSIQELLDLAGIQDNEKYTRTMHGHEIRAMAKRLGGGAKSESRSTQS